MLSSTPDAHLELRKFQAEAYAVCNKINFPIPTATKIFIPPLHDNRPSPTFHRKDTDKTLSPMQPPHADSHNLLVLFLTTAYTATFGAVWLWTCWG
jgi:hypothetical protein